MAPFRILPRILFSSEVDVSKKKAWQKYPVRLTRSVGTRGLPRQTLLIICEGKKTEPNYFRAFKVKSAKIEVEGTGCNTLSLVERTQDVVKSYQQDNITFDQVWCVFDRDDFRESFNAAIFKARSLGFRVAYSNEAFELWYLLHFIYFDSSITRADYISKLDEHLNSKYKKNSLYMYDVLLGRQREAINRAKRLLSKYGGTNPNKEEPSTTVHLLVEELNKYM